jgi:hypothetical protein
VEVSDTGSEKDWQTVDPDTYGSPKDTDVDPSPDLDSQGELNYQSGPSRRISRSEGSDQANSDKSRFDGWRTKAYIFTMRAVRRLYLAIKAILAILLVGVLLSGAWKLLG